MSETLKKSCLSHGLQRCGYHISVLGTIGAGKTTLTEALQRVFAEKEGACHGFYEPVADNELIPLFYENKERYAMTLQIHMLNRRLEQQRCIQDLALNGISCVQDSSVYGDTCFVEMLVKDGVMSKVDERVYSELFLNMTRDVMYPSLIVYLNCPPEVAISRIKKRGRECETGVSLEYVQKLNAEIKDLCDDFSRYTFVKEINAAPDLTQEQIENQALMIYEEVKLMRNKPILTRQGV